LPFLFKKKEKPSTSRFAVLKERGGGRGKGPRGSCLFRATPDLLVDLEEIASFRMRE
jgi:hypothetical protein